MKLTTSQWRDLNWIAQAEHTLWPDQPPSRADDDLKAYWRAGFVEWTGFGWRITPAGRLALSEKADG